MNRGRRRAAATPLPRLPPPLLLLLLWWFLFACSLPGGAAAVGTRLGGGTGASRIDSYTQDGLARMNIRRRQLIGPGSFPPHCTGKCGRCVPCHPVHVTVPPGAHIVAEYYPEAWRCKCGNHLFIP